MLRDDELAALLGRTPDPVLLERADALLPLEVGRPIEAPPDPAHERIVAVGVTLTAATLIGGIILMLLSIVAIVSGGVGLAGVVGLALGAALAGTHWGWVHIAEVTANRHTERRDRELEASRLSWLHQVEPYPRWKVRTSVGQDGSIEIERVLYRPVAVGESRFTFAVEVEEREQHSGDEPGAAVTERAEVMRHRAAADTERERERFTAAAEAYREAVMRDADERERLAAVRAASQALSERINTNLSDPPLT